MKLLILFSVFVLSGFGALSQCQVNPYIEANYTLDANILALRDILADSSDPDYDNPFLPESRVTPYLELLSGIYENPNSDSGIDELFDFFNFHVNQEINYLIEFKTITFSVSTALPWVENFKTTGVSGVPELDNLMDTYQFSIFDFIDFSSSNSTAFFVQTNYEFLNLYALIDDFESITDLNYAEVYPSNVIDYRLNYTGEPYNIVTTEETSPALACDIMLSYDSEENNYLFSFVLYGGDCFAGCTVSETRFFSVDENCQPLSIKENVFDSFRIYPNPASNLVTFSIVNNNPINVVVYDFNGKNVLSTTLKNKTLNISNLNQGIYFLKINLGNQTEIKKLIVE